MFYANIQALNYPSMTKLAFVAACLALLLCGAPAALADCNETLVDCERAPNSRAGSIRSGGSTCRCSGAVSPHPLHGSAGTPI